MDNFPLPSFEEFELDELSEEYKESIIESHMNDRRLLCEKLETDESDKNFEQSIIDKIKNN